MFFIFVTKLIEKMTQIKASLLTLLMFISVLTLSSCDKEQPITDVEGFDYIKASFQNNAGGLRGNLQDITEELINAVNSGKICDSLYTETIEKEHQSIQIISNYMANVSYEMTCNAVNIPQSAAISISSQSLFNTVQIRSDNYEVFTGNVSNLQPSQANISLNGRYLAYGSQELDLTEQKNVQSDYLIDLTNLEINKLSKQIESGNGTILYSGTSVGNFAFGGSIIFNGNKTATIENGGNSYEIEWN